MLIPCEVNMPTQSGIAAATVPQNNDFTEMIPSEPDVMPMRANTAAPVRPMPLPDFLPPQTPQTPQTPRPPQQIPGIPGTPAPTPPGSPAPPPVLPQAPQFQVPANPLLPPGYQEFIDYENLQYLNGFLRTQIGKYMRVEQLVGSNSLQDRYGYLVGVGINYILLQELGTGNIMAVDYYGIKSVYVYFNQTLFPST